MSYVLQSIKERRMELVTSIGVFFINFKQLLRIILEPLKETKAA